MDYDDLTCKLTRNLLNINGFFCIKFKNGDKFEGIFKDGCFNGIGKIIFTDGVILEGFFVNDKLFGQVKIINTINNIVIIYFNDKNNDLSLLLYKNNKFNYELLNGNARILFFNGYNHSYNLDSCYLIIDLNYINGIKQGKAISKSKNECTIFEYVNDKKCGKAQTLVCKNSIMYIIEFEYFDNIKNGNAIIYVNNRFISYFQYKNDCLHGKAKTILANDSIINFEFINNKKNGNASIINKNGDIIYFQYLNNIKHGKAKTIFSNKTIINFEYINNKKNGNATVIYNNGDITYFQYLDDIKYGIVKTIFFNQSTNVFQKNLNIVNNINVDCDIDVDIQKIYKKRPLDILADISIIKQKIAKII